MVRYKEEEIVDEVVYSKIRPKEEAPGFQLETIKGHHSSVCSEDLIECYKIRQIFLTFKYIFVFNLFSAVP